MIQPSQMGSTQPTDRDKEDLKMKMYSSSTVDKMIGFLADHGYDIITVEEGTLGHGHLICLAPDDKHYNVEVKEVALNCWSSAHTVRNFDKISARIARLLENPA